MSPTTTPGEIAYDAWNQAMRSSEWVPWACLHADRQRAWDAAAQAVLDAGPACLLCGTRLVLYRCTRFGDPHWVGCLSCGGIGYTTDCPGVHTEALIAAYAAREREAPHA